VFLLRCDGDLKFREIAEILDVSINSVLGRMHSAVKCIRRELKKELDI
jgi:DNA-directed RNA polymerase specialized sigma24 family protein